MSRKLVLDITKFNLNLSWMKSILELNKILSSTIQLRCVHLYLMWPVIQKITYVFAIWPISCGTTTQPVIWKYMLCYLVRTCQQFGVGAPWFYQYCYISNNSKFLLCADHNVFLYKHSSLKRIIKVLLMIFHFWIGILFFLWNWWKGLPLIIFVLSI